MATAEEIMKLKSAINAAEFLASQYVKRVESYDSAIVRFNQLLQTATAAGDTARIQSLQEKLSQAVTDKIPFEQGLLAEQQKVQALQAELDSALQTAPPTADKPASATASAGDTVKEAQQAKDSPNDDNPNVGSPAPPAQVIDQEGRIRSVSTTTAGTNAVLIPTVSAGDGDKNTNSQLRTLDETQSVSEDRVTTAIAAPGLSTATDGGRQTDAQAQVNAQLTATATKSAGVGAAPDDSGNKNITRTQIDSLFGGITAITPQPNILDQYASYTYSLSVYLMDAAGYKEFLSNRAQGKPANISSFALLFQSGGAPNTGRSPYFKNDYYIDNLQLSSQLTGRGTGSAHNSTKLSFTVSEPYGITLIPNLEKAVTEYIFKNDGKKRNGGWAGQNYMLAIRFYGYDANGRLVQGGSRSPTGTTDPNAFSEKFINFTVSNLGFKIASRIVEYQWDCTTTNVNIAVGQNRGSIPYNIELAAGTLGEALAGDGSTTAALNDGRTTPSSVNSSLTAQTASTSAPTTGTTPTVTTNTTGAPPNAGTAPTTKTTVTKGIIAALNQFQKDLVANGTYSIPDVYEVVFASQVLAQASIVPIGKPNKNNTPMPQNGSPAEKLDKSKQSSDFSTNTIKATAGQQIIQLIEMLCRNSSYIQDQQKIIIDPSDGSQKPNGKAGTYNAWFNIELQSIPIAWDDKRNDYAYNVKYIITPYLISSFDSSYFSNGAFKGVHKKYPYWFTGQNVSVINYEQTYNNLYSRVMSGAPATDTRTSDLQQIAKRIFQPASNQSRQGNAGRTYEPGANAADYLYDPQGLSTSTMTIIGDPAWIYQNEVGGGSGFNPNPFLADGTINNTAGQIYYEISFNLPSDYNLQSGLMYNVAKSINGDLQGTEPTQSYVYQATETTSTFKGGKFTQELQGLLFTPLLGTAASANGNAASTTTNATPSASSANNNRVSGTQPVATTQNIQTGTATPQATLPTVEPVIIRNPG